MADKYALTNLSLDEIPTSAVAPQANDYIIVLRENGTIEKIKVSNTGF